MAHHTHTHTHTQKKYQYTCTHTDTQGQIGTIFYILHLLVYLAYMPPRILILYLAHPQTYTCTNTQDKCIQINTHTHMYRGIDTQIQIHTDTCMFVHIHTYAHRCVYGKSKEMVTVNLLLIQNWPKLLL